MSVNISGSKKMPNFSSDNLEKEIRGLSKEIDVEFIRVLAKIATEFFPYYSWECHCSLGWLFRGSYKEKIQLAEKVAPARESFLIFIGVLLSSGAYFGREDSTEAQRIMQDLNDILLKNIINRDEVITVLKYSGKNEKSAILKSWF